MDCTPDSTEQFCTRCGVPRSPKLSQWVPRMCKATPSIREVLAADSREPVIDESQKKNVGDFLHEAIARWFGETFTAQCGCNSRVHQMNAWGPKGCRDNLTTVVGWLWEESQKREWRLQGRSWWSVSATNALNAMRRWPRVYEALMRWGIRRFVIWTAIRPAERTALRNERKVATFSSRLDPRR
jgi:hypothetical protein